MSDDIPVAKAAIPTVQPEIGVTGLQAYGGLVYVPDDAEPSLRYRQAHRVFREMADYDATIGSFLFLIEMLLRSVEWTAEPVDKTPEAQEAADFVDSVVEDMSHSWEDFIGDVLSMIVYGWSMFEVVWKRRDGEVTDAGWSGGDAPKPPDRRVLGDRKASSRHADGRIGIEKIGFRSQESLNRWEFDRNGDILGMWQDAQAPDGTNLGTVFLPAARCLLFRVYTQRGDPEGRSLLRRAYRSWRDLRKLEWIEVVGWGRAMIGLLEARVPMDWMGAKATPDQRIFVNDFRIWLENAQSNPKAFILLPSDLGDRGEKLIEINLLTPQTSAQPQLRQAIIDKQREMLRTMLSDFLMLGQTATGSFALSVNRTDILTKCLQGIINAIAGVLNRHLIPRMWKINGLPEATMPSLQPGDVAQRDLTALASFINAMTASGATFFPDHALENSLRIMAGLPELPEGGFGPTGVPLPDPLGPADPAAATAAQRNQSLAALLQQLGVAAPVGPPALGDLKPTVDAALGAPADAGLQDTLDRIGGVVT